MVSSKLGFMRGAFREAKGSENIDKSYIIRLVANNTFTQTTTLDKQVLLRRIPGCAKVPLMLFEILNFPFVFLCRLKCTKSSKVSTLVGFRIFLSGIKPVFAGF